MITPERHPYLSNAARRYHNDAVFKQVVQSLYQLIEEARMTSGDLMEATMYARYLWEQNNPQSLAHLFELRKKSCKD